MTANLINPLQKAAFSAISMTRPASEKDKPESQALKDRRENRIIHAFHGPKREIPAAKNSFLLRKETNVLPQSDETSSAKRLLLSGKAKKKSPPALFFLQTSPRGRTNCHSKKTAISPSGLARKPASCASHARPAIKKKGIRRKECHSTRPAPLKYGGILHRPPRRDGIRDSRAPPVTF